MRCRPSQRGLRRRVDGCCSGSQRQLCRPPLNKCRLVSRDDISAGNGSEQGANWRTPHLLTGRVATPLLHIKSLTHNLPKTNPQRRMSSALGSARKHEKKKIGVMSILLTRHIPTTLDTGEWQHCNSGKPLNPGGRRAAVEHVKRTAQKILTAITNLWFQR